MQFRAARCGHPALRGARGRHAGIVVPYEGTGGQVVVPYGWLRRAAAIALGSGAQRSICGAVAREWAGNAAEITPKVSSNAGQSLSHGLWPCQLPLHKGALVLREDVLPIAAGS